jgi:hypothetical protein
MALTMPIQWTQVTVAYGRKRSYNINTEDEYARVSALSPEEATKILR